VDSGESASSSRRIRVTKTAATAVRNIFLHLRREDGIALVMSLGVLLTLTVAGTSTVYYVTQNHTSTAYSKTDRMTGSLAEAGLAYAYSTLYNSGTPTMPNAVPEQTVPINGGTVTYSGTLSGSTWTLVSVARMRNPGGQNDVVKTVRGKVTVGSAQQGTANNAVWNYVYSDSLDTCMPLNNSVVVDVPLYVRGDICMQNSAQIRGPILQVGGKVTLENSSQIGAPGPDEIPEIHIAGGCKWKTNPLHNPCGPADLVYGQVVDSNPTGLTKPPVDLAKWYTDSQPGPMHGCTTGSFPGGFDNDTVMNRSRGDVDLMPSTGYDCQVRDASGNLIGQITWVPGSPGSPGNLYIAGTIFIDGNILLTNSDKGIYHGKATLYASGRIVFQNANDLCGSPLCDEAWDPETDMLALVAGSSTDADGIDFVNATRFQGALYAVNDIRQRNSVEIWGPQIARQIYLMNSVENHYVPLGTLLPGMPASYTEVLTISNEPGSWGY
jgi:Tfp pilus assembly protein PilX